MMRPILISSNGTEGRNLTNVGLKVMQFMVHSIPKFHLTNLGLKVMQFMVRSIPKFHLTNLDLKVM